MFDDLPPWGRPAARVALALALIGVVLLLAAYGTILFVPLAPPSPVGYLVAAFGLAGGVAIGCAVIIGLFILWRGQWRGDW